MMDTDAVKSRRLNRDKILEAARNLIEVEGAHSFSIRSLSKALGVSPMALYRHTKDRSALLGSVLDMILMQLEERSDIRISDRSFGDLAYAYGDLAMNNPQVFIAFISDRDAKSIEAETLSQHMIEALIRVGHRAKDAPIIRDIVVDHTHGYLLASAAHKDPSVLGNQREDYAAASQLLIERLMV